MVLLHEGLGCVAMWRDFPVALAERTGCGVLAHSRAGYGQSDPMPLPWPLDYMTRHAQTVLPEVLDAAGVQRFALIGHSDGATIAAVYAGTVPDVRIEGVCLIAPHFFAEPEGLARIALARGQFETGDLRARLSKYHAHVDCAFGGWSGSWLHPDFRKWNVADVLDTIAVPVLAVQGTDDPYGTLAQIDVIRERCATGVRDCILPGIGHAPQIEDADTVERVIADFIGEL